MPLQWVFPQLETEETSPSGPPDGGFGPIYLNDQITLLFSPTTYTGNLSWYCDWDDTQQGAFWTIPNPNGSPLTYTFNETTPNANDTSDVHICHFYNLDGTIGNSQTFQYFNFPNKQPTSWSQAGSTPIVSASTTTQASATSTSGSSTATDQSAAETSQPGSTPSASPSPAGGPAISAGAAVGITIGAVAVIILVLLFLLRRRIWRSKYARRDGAQATTAVGTEAELGQHNPPPTQDMKGWYGPGAGGTRMAEKDGTPAAAEMGESSAGRHFISELPADN